MLPVVAITSRPLHRGSAPVTQYVQVGAVEAVEEPSTLWCMLGIVGGAVGAYHGWKRTGSIGWTVGWTALGSMFPIPATAVAFAQGFGKKA